MAANNLELNDRNAFLALSPPRHVPASVIKAAAPLREMVISMVVGIAFLLLGLGLLWRMSPSHLLNQWKLSNGATQTTPGKILSSETTQTRINKRSVIKYQFSYQPNSSAPRTGTAYTTGRLWDKDATVTVRYLQEDPAVALPEGARLNVMGNVALIVVAVILTAGAAMVFGAIYSRRARLGILRYGHVTAATVDSIESTWYVQNKRAVYIIHLTRMDNHTALKKRTNNPVEVAMAQEKMDSKDPMAILYDPNKPRRFLLPEIWGI